MTSYRITPEDRQYVDEFRQRPLGPHSPNLLRILNLMRAQPMAGKYCLICLQPFTLWQLAQFTGQRGEPAVPVPGVTYTDLAAAEWDVFRRRWRALTGEDVN